MAVMSSLYIIFAFLILIYFTLENFSSSNIFFFFFWFTANTFGAWHSLSLFSFLSLLAKIVEWS